MALNVNRFLAAVGACCMLTGFAFAQDESSKPRVFEGFDGTHCETTKAELDLIAERAGQERLIIIIARLGRKEFSRAISRRRLHNLSEYLEMTRAIPAKRIITAEADRVSGLGQVEIYLGGKLFTVFKVNRNRDLARGCSTA